MDRLAQLASSLDALVAREQRAQREAVTGLLDTVQALQGGSADRRYVLLVARLKQLREQLDQLGDMIREDYLAKIAGELEVAARLHMHRVALHKLLRQASRSDCDPDA
jgi:hypothetical protein